MKKALCEVVVRVVSTELRSSKVLEELKKTKGVGDLDEGELLQ